jgi:hypothetical protein
MDADAGGSVMVKLKAGDVLNVTKDIKLLTQEDWFKVCTGPKQGDVVFGRFCAGGGWFEGLFVSAYEEVFLAMSAMGEVYVFKEMTTTDPYALRYELTAQQALVAAWRGEVVESKLGDRFKFNKATVVKKRVEGGAWCASPFQNDDLMYAIVEGI